MEELNQIMRSRLPLQGGLGIDVLEEVAEKHVLAAYYVAGHLRGSDAREIYRATGKVPGCAVLTTWSRSKRKWIIFKNAKPIGLFGVDAGGEGQGIPWMVGTPEMANIGLFISKNSAKYIAKMKEVFATLVNYVDVENKVSIAWLEWCGARIYPSEPYGPQGHLFHPFELRV